MEDFDFVRANVLMDCIVKAGQHGPIFQKLASMATEELKAMLDEGKPAATEMPPAGGTPIARRA